MSRPQSQTDAFEDPDTSPAALWRRDAARHALDDLFSVAGRYRDTRDYKELLDFTIRFRGYSPFNAMLLHIQMAGARYVAPASRWRRDYGRRIGRGERPLVILQPMGPVMFVFDVSQTEPDVFGAKDIPDAVLNPFKAVGSLANELHTTIVNCTRDGVGVQFVQQGSQSAGEIQGVIPGEFLEFETTQGPPREFQRAPRRYDIQLNQSHDPATAYGTLVHELAHLYCGHLGTPDPAWWPDRRGMDGATREFEAESVSYLVCGRLGLQTRSAQYLSGCVESCEQTPAMSLDRVMASAGLIEQMGRTRLKPRPHRPTGQLRAKGVQRS